MNSKKLKTNNLREKPNCYSDILRITFTENDDDFVRRLEIRVNERDASLEYYKDRSNCKLGYLNFSKRLIDMFYGSEVDMTELVVDLFKDVFDRVGRPIIYVTVTSTEHMEFIKKNFKCYFINRIPFGDDNGQQFHIAIINEKQLESLRRIRNSLNEESVKSIHVFEEKNAFSYEEEESTMKSDGLYFGSPDPFSEAMHIARDSILNRMQNEAQQRAQRQEPDADLEEILQNGE